MSEREALFPFRELGRDELEKLLAAHREEFLSSFFEHVNPDRENADDCLADFEQEVLNGE